MNLNTRFLIFLIITGYIGLGMLIISLLIDRKKSKRIREILKEEKRSRSKFNLL